MFYSGMAIAMAVTVFIGFARTYYLSAYFGTHGTIGGGPFSTIIRVHAMLFTTWVLLFLPRPHWWQSIGSPSTSDSEWR